MPKLKTLFLALTQMLLVACVSPSFLMPLEDLGGDIFSNQSETERVIQLSNQERTQRGLSALRSNAQLNRAAQAYAEKLAQRGVLSHSLDSTLTERIQQAGYRYSMAAENIAQGQPSPSSAVNGWMNSPGHRQNLLNPDLQDIGVGVANSIWGGKYWVQKFASPQ